MTLASQQCKEVLFKEIYIPFVSGKKAGMTGINNFMNSQRTVQLHWLSFQKTCRKREWLTSKLMWYCPIVENRQSSPDGSVLLHSSPDQSFWIARVLVPLLGNGNGAIALSWDRGTRVSFVIRACHCNYIPTSGHVLWTRLMQAFYYRCRIQETYSSW